MIRVQDIRSVTDFYRHAHAHLKRLKQTGRPELLTINGKAVLVVQDAAAYQQLLEKAESQQRGRRLASRR
jgi:PHD/YefM family antitoxin component YafN of YafNO toxin-antitoxin module